MEIVAVKAAGWVVGKALGSVTGTLLEAWAFSKGLGPKVDALKVELLCAQAMLEYNTHGREIHNPVLKELLLRLQLLAYGADNVLDEIEYFRIQDELDGTYHAADAHAGGCVHDLLLNARHTSRAVAAKLKPSSSSRHTIHGEHGHGCLSSVVCSCGGGTGKCSPHELAFSVDDCAHSDMSEVSNTAGNGCRNTGDEPDLEKKAGNGCLCAAKPFLCAWTSKARQRKYTKQAPKQKFNRVGISAKMEDITEHLKYVCAKVYTVLNLEFMGTTRMTRITTQDLANKRPTITTLDITETELLYGREQQKKIIHEIVHGNSSADNDLVVLPIFGPGGVGKTTLTQHVYEELKSHFDMKIWVCVSPNFSASSLAEEIVKIIPRVDGEKRNSSVQELIEQRLKAKRFLLVLDDIRACLEDDWNKLLAPFRRGGTKGSVVIVTTRIPEVANLVKWAVDCPIELVSLEGEGFMEFFEACIFSGQKPWEGQTADLRGVGEQIVSKLKGSPLAAKTVGRILRSQLTLEHWNRVLESKEWELQTSDNDIMPALKISYDYLPFHLQQCFYYCALFPEDYEFDSKELVHLWIGLDIVQQWDLTRRIEDVGLCYLNDLVNHGFLKKSERHDGSFHYVVHDLLHDFVVNISSFECLSLYSSNMKSIHIRQDVRHLSIIIDNKDVEDIKTFKNYKNYLSALDKRLNFENLRTLMVFGGHHESFANIFCDLFGKARALRAIYLYGASSYTMVDMLHKFPKQIHLRYIKIKLASYAEDIDFNLSALTRLYHLKVIDMQECKGRYSYGFSRHMSNLAKLCHFLVPQDNNLQLHSNIVDVGKLKLLQELRSFEVGRETKGFELSQLGQLSELGGSLSICRLERIRAVEDAHEARLTQIKHLKKLTLEWDANRPEKDTTSEENVLEILIPPSNLKDLFIKGHGGTKCPKWLGEHLSIKYLESLRLDGVDWNIFPPIGDLWPVNGPHEEISSNIHHKRYQNLRRLELVNLPRLKKWIVKSPCHLVAHLEVLIIKDCHELTNMSFSHSTCCQREQEEEANMNWFPGGLQVLKIKDCPKLSSFPLVPWTRAPCSAKIERVGSGLEKLVCEKNNKSEYCLNIKMNGALVSELWNVLAFDNLSELKELSMDTCPPLPLHHFQMLSSLKTLRLYGGSSIVFLSAEGESHAGYQSPIECITIGRWNASVKELTQLLTYFPKLSELSVFSCEKITGLAVLGQQATETPILASPDNKVDDDTEIEQQQQQEEEEVGTSAAEGLLHLPSQLQTLCIRNCLELSLGSNLINHNGEAGAGQTGGGQGLQGMCSLRRLLIDSCPRFLSSYSLSSSSSYPPFPSSLERLSLYSVVGSATPLPLSNLASLTYLIIMRCGDLRAEGLRHLLAQGRLTQLTVYKTPNFFAGPEPPLPHDQEFPSSSSKLQDLQTDDVAGVLAAPICTLLSSSLTELRFDEHKKVERFTKEQEDALQLLTSLEKIRFWSCDKLQCLPAALHGLPNLKRLNIFNCPAFRSLPKDGLPISLQELEIDNCPTIQSLPKDCLPTSLQKLVIKRCPTIRSLPKDGLPSSLQKLKIYNCPNIRSLPKVNDLPSSLRELDVRGSRNEELRRQCRKLIGIIPVVYAD